MFDSSNTICDCCHYAKQTKLAFPLSTIKTTSSFELIHMDIWGPFAPSSVHSHSYFLTIIDDYTIHTWTFLMKAKLETRPLITQFISLVLTQLGKHVKQVRTENGKEFLMDSYFKDKGIIHQSTYIEKPQ